MITFEGCGHAFAGDGGGPVGDAAKRAADARDAWFEKYLAKPQPKPEVKPLPEVKPPATAPAKLSAQYAVVDLSAGPAGPCR